MFFFFHWIAHKLSRLKQNCQHLTEQKVAPHLDNSKSKLACDRDLSTLMENLLANLKLKLSVKKRKHTEKFLLQEHISFSELTS